MINQLRIPGSRLDQQHRAIRDQLVEAMTRVLERGSFTADAEAEAFETEFAQFLGARHAVGVASGGAAVTIALKALGVGHGDEVISVPNVDIAASAPITHTGARVVWVDIQPRTYNLDPDRLEEAITARTRAIVVVHMYGNPADMDAILSISRRHGIPVVEDAALAHGATYRGDCVGVIGDIGCFSFSPGKILGATGQAGVLVTQDADLARRARVLSNYGFEPASLLDVRRGRVGAQFRYVEEGYNAGLDELHAAVLRVKLRHLPTWVERRRRHARVYREALVDLDPEFLLLPIDTAGAQPSYRVFVIRTPQRDRLMAHLAADGIWTGLHYVPPLHLQPLYQRLGYAEGSFPVTEQVAAELLCLPTVPELSNDEVQNVADAVNAYFAEFGRPFTSRAEDDKREDWRTRVRRSHDD